MPGTVSNRSKSGDSARLEHRLVLLSWLHEQLGYGNTPQLLEDIKQAAEGFDHDGLCYIYLRLISRGNKLQISPDDLARYDDNIRKCLDAMNAGRAEPLTLRYFQYLAALYAAFPLTAPHPASPLQYRGRQARQKRRRKGRRSRCVATSCSHASRTAG